MALKVLNLACDQEHAFEGWFSSENDYESQLERGLLVCPVCESQVIRKTPSAPRLNLGATEPAAPQQRGSAPQQPGNAPMQANVLPSPQQLQALYLRMARELAANTEDVGERFADEARRIHYHEAEERGIRGVTSPDEARELLDEGIGILPLPFGALVKEPLQ
jgi:hypothetical protein